ncbi:TonB-dependent receptor [Pedobacter sp. MW01-1-1]|uniref:TonB-dependent receptor n=1 Tax=Pedobacter sp. MW01-1-1 TaxID=3383027 RepID=UPI003FEDC06D
MHLKIYFSFLLFANFIILSFQLSAQTIPLAKRNVSGILRDSLNAPIVNATISLISEKDTLKTQTNAVGYWGFKGVKSAEFLLQVKVLGYSPYNKKYFNNDTKAQISIPPIQLGGKALELEAVTIKGIRGPAVKGDTTEFWASDYIVRNYARLGDLLKRMEGITIDSEGSVFYNGERVVKALLNNSNYFDGSVKDAIKELPADIVERIQIIDQNATTLGSKSIKTEESVKVLNIVTKPGKSAGKMYNGSLSEGSSGRLATKGSIRRIDAADQLSANAGYDENPMGLNPTKIPGTLGNMMIPSSSNVSSGKSKNITAGLSKSVKIGKFSFSPNYNFTNQNLSTTTKTFSEDYYSQGNLSKEQNDQENVQSNRHTLNGFFNYSSKNTRNINGNIQIAYNEKYNEGNNSFLQNGIVNNFTQELTARRSKTFSYSFNGTFGQTISEKLRFSSNINSSLTNGKAKEDDKIDIFSTQDIDLKPDSTLSQFKQSTDFSLTNTLTNLLTWSYSKKMKVQGEFMPSNTYSLRDIKAYLIDDFESVFNSDLSNYQQENKTIIPLKISVEYNFTNGFYLSPAIKVKNQWLRGKLMEEGSPVSRSDFFAEPSLAVGYFNKKVGKIDLRVNSLFTQPQLNQLNPSRFYLTPYQIQVGNPDLENSKQMIYSVTYSNYFKKLKLNASITASLNLINNLVTVNRSILIDPNSQVFTTVNSYANINGYQSYTNQLSLTKTLQKINTTLNFSGFFVKGQFPYFAEGKIENRNSTNQNYKLSSFYGSLKWLELTPEIRYSSVVDMNSLAMGTAAKTYNRNFSADLKIAVFMPKDWSFASTLTQSLYQTTNVVRNTSPFVVNANIEKRILKNRTAIISLAVMDLAKQNAVIGYSSTNSGYINRVTNPESRYYLLQFSWQPQIWGKSKYGAGAGRTGSGSPIIVE